MTYNEHIAQVNRFLYESLELLRRRSDMLAAEAVWGAVIQAMAAVSHALGERGHPRRLAFILGLEGRYNAAPRLTSGFRAAQRKLHNHFYTGRLRGQDLEEAIGQGRTLISQLLDIAEQERRRV